MINQLFDELNHGCLFLVIPAAVAFAQSNIVKKGKCIVVMCFFITIAAAGARFPMNIVKRR